MASATHVLLLLLLLLLLLYVNVVDIHFYNVLKLLALELYVAIGQGKRC
jgi:hypothetical protein